ncbi:hypothetical protein HHK36_023183 [Tetracentron sinense]|uniref:Urease accessory protein D n=1 Tax=Tetracentron sinense TaxID=13715 RepID=A0A834YKU3_TETSI|nr:hypothetical protein HHK36_023183 [Tetracentron sinense]
METGFVVVEKVGGKSTVTRCFSKYPLKFIIPKKGDCISCGLTIGTGCTTVLTTQASTKVYKSVGSKVSEQVLESRIESNAFLVIIPDPVTCFSTARYSQKQVFRVVSDSSLVIVDWITSGRHESGEKWDFNLYKSTNHIFLEGDQPLFLDSILLEQGSMTSIAERMQDYQVIAMVVLLGDGKIKEINQGSWLLGCRPKLKHAQHQVQEDMKRMMSQQFYSPSSTLRSHTKTSSDHGMPKPALIASCSVFGPKGIGMVVRIAAMTTESVYSFLRHQLASLEPLLGASPYH